MKRIYFVILVIIATCTRIGCGSTRHITQLVRDIHKDTVYLKDVSIEYRYKLLRDTVRIVQRDSIPYEVTVTEIKEITRPLALYDKICRACFWFLLGILGFYLIRYILKLRKL